MKTISIAALLAALLLIVTAGCANAAGTQGFAESDLTLTISGTAYRLDEDIRPVLEQLGGDYAYAEGLSCAYDSVDKTFTYALATFYTNPMQEGDIISMIYTESPAVTTSRGIAAGDSRDEVIAAYGEDVDDMGNLLVYRLAGADGGRDRGSLCFDLDGDAVASIFITTEPV